MSPTDAYFSRQVVVDGLGAEAQKRLARSKVLVAGLGGTGSALSVNLALAGVGFLSLVDRDEVAVENLHRQPIYSAGDIGASKAETAAAFLEARAPGLRVRYRAESLDGANASRLLRGVDLAVDCLDNMPSKKALNLACVRRRIPLVYTGSLGWEGSVAVLSPPMTPCLECLFPAGEDDALPSCDEIGSLGAVTSVVGAIGALESIKLLAGLGSSLEGRVLFFDGRRGSFHTAVVRRRKDCQSCGALASQKDEKARQIIQLCGRDEYYVSRAFSPGSLPLILRRVGPRATLRGTSVVSVDLGEARLSFFKHGGLLVKGAGSLGGVRRLLDGLGLSPFAVDSLSQTERE